MGNSDPPQDASDSQLARELLLTEFTTTGPDLGWYVLNDNVMGGQSAGSFNHERGKLTFSGYTNTSGGGFSSIRTKTLKLNLSAYAGIRLKVQGDGRTYTWRLSTDAFWHATPIGYWADFETHSGTWITISIPFSSFTPRVRGQQLDGPALDPGRITGMGLMIYDRQDGPFEMQLGSVHAYTAEAP